MGGLSRWEQAYPLIEPRIDSAGIHVWPFNPACPIDVLFWRFSGVNDVRMNRHSYFEILFVESGELVFNVQHRIQTVREGDLFVIGADRFHGLTGKGNSTAKALLLISFSRTPSVELGPPRRARSTWRPFWFRMTILRT